LTETRQWSTFVPRYAYRNKKLQNYLEFIALWPEYDTVFVGDNGQGDVMVAAEAIEMGCPVEGAFIHKACDAPGNIIQCGEIAALMRVPVEDCRCFAEQLLSLLPLQVIPLENTFGYEEGCEERWPGMKINFFHSYAGAAVKVLRHW
jgi:hypothetical protein